MTLDDLKRWVAECSDPAELKELAEAIRARTRQLREILDAQPEGSA